MTLDTLIMFSGGFVAVLPFLGFPNTWDNVFFFLAGVFIIGLGVVARRRGLGITDTKKEGSHLAAGTTDVPQSPDTTQGGF